MFRLILAALLLQVAGVAAGIAEAKQVGLLSEAMAVAVVAACLYRAYGADIVPRHKIALDHKERTKETSELKALLSTYEAAAISDPLTSLLNRRGGEQVISRCVSRTRRTRTALSYLLLDVDYFKRVNDEYGHNMGDEILKTVCATVKSTVRITDHAVRWGGEEILIILPDTDLEGAVIVGEKLRHAVADVDYAHGKTVTVSIGAAETVNGEDFMTTIARADMQLYVAKSNGRNQVCPVVTKKEVDTASSYA
jgi:diguanylate cyclase (GGDEF)-like protein